MLADSIAMEREKKTLEPLLSSPLHISQLIVGKVFFCFVCSTLYFLVCTMLAFLTGTFVHLADCLTIRIFIFILMATILSLFTFTTVGILLSSKSMDLHTANHRIAIVNYLLGFPLIIYVDVLFLEFLSHSGG